MSLRDDRPTIEEIREKFGQEAADQYIALLKATRSLVNVWGMYSAAPAGSIAEQMIQTQMERMLADLIANPEHAVTMVESLLAIIMNLRYGGSYDEWFESVGLSPNYEQEEA